MKVARSGLTVSNLAFVWIRNFLVETLRTFIWNVRIWFLYFCWFFQWIRSDHLPRWFTIVSVGAVFGDATTTAIMRDTTISKSGTTASPEEGLVGSFFSAFFCSCSCPCAFGTASPCAIAHHHHTTSQRTPCFRMEMPSSTMKSSEAILLSLN